MATMCAVSASATFFSMGAGPLKSDVADQPSKASATKVLQAPNDGAHGVVNTGSTHTGLLRPIETVDGRLIPQIQRGDRGTVYPQCLVCHDQIESATINMGFDLDCTFCHGGDPNSAIKEIAHVLPTLPVIMDNTVAPLDYDLPYQQFVNPSNLRVVKNTCGACHPFKVDNIFKSMMATAAGHYAGGLYLNGNQKTKTPIYGTFAVEDNDGVVPVEKGAVPSLLDLIEYDPTGDPKENSTHFAAVPAQACARCHLWSRGKGYRGASDAEGTYRADGCVACHMLYDNDGLSQSADMTIDHTETGHPRVHVVTKEITTEQCLHCHHRGARIGLNFTGRSQMPPRLPSGPDYAGTTNEKFNSNYHYAVDGVNTPDVHFQRGLDCIDCHTARGIMGDGNIYGHMDQATKIECRMCHGMPGELPTMIDHDGLPLRNTYFEFGEAKLVTKVKGTVHTIPMVKDIVDPASPRYNALAACAMNGNHLKDVGGLECYACHSTWTANCFGCHFERDEQYMGRNLVTREYEVGRVKTNNKVFETFRPFFIGPNSEGRVAPYLVACQPIADVTAPDGSKVLDFQMPSTAKGVSGLSLNPVQPHSVQGAGTVRTCAECHRSPASLGMGTGNYSLARDYAYLATSGGIAVYDRMTDPESPVLMATIPVTDPHAFVTRKDPIEGTADVLYVAAGTDGLLGFHVESSPIGVAPVQMVSGINAIDVERVSKYFFVVDEGVGVHVYDSMEGPRHLSVQNPFGFNGVRVPNYITTIDIPDAQSVLVFGIHLFVAAGDGGMIVVNIADQEAPIIEGSVTGINAQDIRIYSHYQQGKSFAVRAYVADPDQGVHVIDLLPNLSSPVLINTIAIPGAVGLDSYTAWLIGDEVTPSYEHDYLYVAAGTAGLYIFDMTEPDNMFEVAHLMNLGGSVDAVDVASQMSPPGVDDYAMIANSVSGLQVVDVTEPTKPVFMGTTGSAGMSAVLVEVMPLDRFMDEQALNIKENSHPFIKNFRRADIVRILSASIEECEPGVAGSHAHSGSVNTQKTQATTVVRVPNDLNGDGVVNYFDLSKMIKLFNTSDKSADLNGDGIVNMEDVQVLLDAM